MNHATAIKTCELVNPRCEPHHRVIPDSSVPSGDTDDLHEAGRPQKLGECPSAVEVSDFESDSPLLEQHAIGVEKTEFGIVNVRCFRCDPVQLHDFEVTTCHEVLPRRNTNVKAPEEETIEGQCNSTDDFFQGWSNRVVSVQEDSTATMGPDLDQLNSFSSRGHLLNPFCIVAQVKV